MSATARSSRGEHYVGKPKKLVANDRIGNRRCRLRLASKCQLAVKGTGAAPAGGALKITDVQTILTAPARIRLVVVKVVTSEPGLYGLGCATFTQRARVVETAVKDYLRPFLLGKDPTRIEDLWQSLFVSSYWRNGPVLNNAISGVDMALWDIQGKRANMPVYQLLGGKCREAVDVYRHASGSSYEDCEQQVRRYMQQGYRTVRIQVNIPGQATYGAGAGGAAAGQRARSWEPGPYVRTVPKLFEYMRKHVGDDVELLHDMHERCHRFWPQN